MPAYQGAEPIDFWLFWLENDWNGLETTGDAVSFTLLRLECRCIYGVGNFVPPKQKFRDLYALLRSEEPRMTGDVRKAEENAVKLRSQYGADPNAGVQGQEHLSTGVKKELYKAHQRVYACTFTRDEAARLELSIAKMLGVEADSVAQCHYGVRLQDDANGESRPLSALIRSATSAATLHPVHQEYAPATLLMCVLDLGGASAESASTDMTPGAPPLAANTAATAAAAARFAAAYRCIAAHALVVADRIFDFKRTIACNLMAIGAKRSDNGPTFWCSHPLTLLLSLPFSAMSLHCAPFAAIFRYVIALCPCRCPFPPCHCTVPLSLPFSAK